MPNQRGEDFWRELADINERAQQIQQQYIASRDALFERYGRPQDPRLDVLWRDYCQCVRQLSEVLEELQHAMVGGKVS